MPIPVVPFPAERSSESPGGLRLVENKEEPCPLTRRSFAHAVDLMVVQGFSLYTAKLGALLLVTPYMSFIEEQKGAPRIFASVIQFGSLRILLASFFLISLLYFGGLLFWKGRTLGMALVGAELRGEDGAKPDAAAVVLRVSGYLFSLVTFGALFLFGFRPRGQGFFHDRWSGTFIRKN